MKNMNTMPSSSAPTESYDSGWDDVIDYSKDKQSMSPSWGSLDDKGWDSPIQSSDSGWGEASPAATYSFNELENRSSFGEKLEGLKDKLSRSLGRKALETVISKLPSFGGKTESFQAQALNIYDDPSQMTTMHEAATMEWDQRSTYVDQGVSVARSAAIEVAGAGVTAARESVMKYYGLEKRVDEMTGDEKLRIQKKIKFGKAVVKTVFSPLTTASSVGGRAAYSARKAVKYEAKNQFAQARAAATSFAEPQMSSHDADEW